MSGNRTAWTAGNGVGLTWSSAFNGSDLASLPNGDSVLSSIADIANGTNLDMYADVSVELTISSTAIGAGAYGALYLAALMEDGSTYGDGSMASGSQAANVPAYAPCGIIPVRNATLTLLAGFVQGILLPPGSFRFGFWNQFGVTLSSTAGNCVIKYRTYNINLNN